MLILIPRVQVVPLYRVRLALGFIVGNLQLKPLCGWSACQVNHRYALSRGVSK